MLLNCGIGEDSRVPWTARRSNQSILKEISPEYSLEGLMLKLKHQYFGHLMQRTDWCWERLKVGGEEDDRGWDGWMASLTRRTRVSVSSRSLWWTGRPGVLQSMGSQRIGHNWATELSGYRVSVWVIKGSKVDWGSGCANYEYTKNHLVVHFKWDCNREEFLTSIRG